MTLKATALARVASRPADPGEGLSAVAALRRELNALEASHVDSALRAGWSWTKIAGALGVSKQAAHKKHAKRGRAAAGGNGRDGARQRLVVTGRARWAVQFAREEATALGHDSVGTEHLLLGLLREAEGPAALALSAAGITLDAAREVVGAEGRLGGGIDGSPNGVARPRRERAADRLPISAAARPALEQSLREAVGRGDDHLGVEDLLLAILRERTGGARRALSALGVSAAAVEGQLAKALEPAASDPAG